MTEDSTASRELLASGSEITGSAIGGFIGGVFAGPVGGAIGGAGGAAAAKGLRLLADFAHRQLSVRERIRVGAAFGFAIATIQAKLQAGETPREDGFFDSSQAKRSNADTILEGVVLRCRDEYQEAKVRLIANIYAEVAFDPTISPSDAELALGLAGELTYRQLCMVALVGRRGEFKVGSFSKFTRKQGQSDPALRWEWTQLYNRYWLTMDTDDVPNLSRLGSQCFRLMGLTQIDPRHIAETYQELKDGLRFYDKEHGEPVTV